MVLIGAWDLMRAVSLRSPAGIGDKSPKEHFYLSLYSVNLPLSLSLELLMHTVKRRMVDGLSGAGLMSPVLGPTAEL